LRYEEVAAVLLRYDRRGFPSARNRPQEPAIGPGCSI
jgi:hypothetical protein